MKRIRPVAVSRPATRNIAVFFALSSVTTVLAQEVSDRPTGAGAEQAEIADTSDETPDEDGREEIFPVITTGAPPGTTLDDESKPPPVITGIAAAYTDKGSWGAGIGIRWNARDGESQLHSCGVDLNIEEVR